MVLSKNTIAKKNVHRVPFRVDWKRNKALYFMVLPVLLYYIIFSYIPMFGVVIAFEDYVPALGIFKSTWVGLQNFVDFFTGQYSWRILKNTLVISLSTLVFGFPAPIILALLVNEIRNRKFVRTVQTITYLPHFISLVVVVGLIKSFTDYNGIIGLIYQSLTGEKTSLLMKPNLFVPIYVISGIWQEMGWSAIIYFAALTNIDQQLYESASIDGAGRLRQTFSITLPCLAPTIIIMLILRIGSILNVGYEKIILMYNDATLVNADVISSYVYRKGLLEYNWGYSTAVGLFNSVINVIFLIGANMLSKKFSDTNLW